MPKQFFSDEMNNTEKMIMRLIASEINLAAMKRLPLKTIYLQPQYFQVFEDLNKKCFTEDELKEANYEYTVQKVHIEKGTYLQRKISQVDYWPIGMNERQKNREAQKMRDIILN